jgi:phage terminase large subunit-like protein
MERPSLEDCILLGAENTPFFGRVFFPRAVRMDSPKFHYTICKAVEDPANEKVAVKVLRGGAKTTLARIICAKRIAYGISKTILIVSETAEHSYETVKWLKHAVERGDIYARAFGLERGDKHTDPFNGEKYTWRDDKIQIYHKQLGAIITVVGTGIFGQSRGLNIEDYRPDFILLDDIQDEDNAKTAEQRKKVNDRVYGAITNTLAPRSEAPNATILFIQTPIHKQDAIELAKEDPEWVYIEVGCFDENGESVWPERWSTEELRRKKQGFINRNQLSLWLKEWEVKVTDDELSYFKNAWIEDNYYEVYPDKMITYIGIDPTPPPKESDQLSSAALKDLDNFVITVIGIQDGTVYVLDSWKAKSPYPAEVNNALFSLVAQWKPLAVGVETILFARTIKYDIEKEMLARRMFFRIMPIEDRRKKTIRIRQELTGLLSQGKLRLKKDMVDLIGELQSYPDVAHDDHLDSLAIALMCMNPSDMDYIEGEFMEVEDYQVLENWRGCPAP